MAYPLDYSCCVVSACFFSFGCYMILWAPSRNPTRYAYAGDTGDDYDEEAISLTTGVKVEGCEVGTMMERKEKKGSASTDHLVGLTEDLAEDKRE